MGVSLFVAFGLVGARRSCCAQQRQPQGRAATVGGLRLSADQVKGRELFARSCTTCHTLAAVKSVGRIGPNLDVRVGEDIPTAAGRKALVENAIAEGRARGLGQMPALLYQGKEAEDVASVRRCRSRSLRRPVTLASRRPRSRACDRRLWPAVDSGGRRASVRVRAR